MPVILGLRATVPCNTGARLQNNHFPVFLKNLAQEPMAQRVRNPRRPAVAAPSAHVLPLQLQLLQLLRPYFRQMSPPCGERLYGPVEALTSWQTVSLLAGYTFRGNRAFFEEA